MQGNAERSSGRIVLSTVGTMAALLGLLAGPARAADDAQKCEANKNKAAGKYYFCREKAQAKAILTGDPADFSKCTAKFDDKWDLLENNVPGACPDNVTLTSDMDTYIAGQAADAAAIIAGTQNVPTCGDNLINVAGEQCDGSDLGGESCTSLGFGGGTLACASCALDTGGCTFGGCTGNAAVGDVLAGKTFSNGSMTGLNGTMPDNGAQTINPGTSNQAITAGYHNGSGYCAGDADLAASNIKSGANIFGVAGSVIEASGNATSGDVLATKTFSNASMNGLTGGMPDNSAQTINPGTSNQAITAGYHNGSGYCAGDADLVAGNIKNGVNLFGVAGTVQPPPLKTAQTTDYGTGSDGNALLRKGASRSYTDNGDGTVTDNTTGLMWEKKSDDGTIHDKDDTYTWGMTSMPYTMNGTMVTTFLATLNGGGGFAGHTDWRIPNVNELQGIANYQNVSPAVDAAFNTGCVPSCTVTSCSCAQGSYYWSSTTLLQGSPDYAWFCYDGSVSIEPKSSPEFVRAVRGGS